MNRKTRSNVRIRLALVAAFGVALLFSAQAFAGPSSDSDVTLATENPFHGKVKADDGVCRRDRTVRIISVASGSPYASIVSDAQGKYKYDYNPSTGYYYAKLLALKVNGKNRCQGARSKKVYFK